MNKNPRVYNQTRGWHMKRSAADKAVENCACVWVEEGKTLRDATIEESIQMRNEQAKLREPLADAEIPGLIFTGKQDFNLIRAANDLFPKPRERYVSANNGAGLLSC